MIQGIDKYFEPFSIERMSISYDDFGSPTEAYTALKTASGRIRMLNASERFVNDKETQIGTHKLYTREADIKASDRVVYRGNKYHVLYVNNVMNFNELYQVEMELVSDGI